MRSRAWLWPCRHMSGFGSECPDGLPASVQPTVGDAVRSFPSPEDPSSLGALPSCLCVKPHFMGTTSRPCARLAPSCLQARRGGTTCDPQVFPGTWVVMFGRPHSVGARGFARTCGSSVCGDPVGRGPRPLLGCDSANKKSRSRSNDARAAVTSHLPSRGGRGARRPMSSRAC
jgi:hypothetical protein